MDRTSVSSSVWIFQIKTFPERGTNRAREVIAPNERRGFCTNLFRWIAIRFKSTFSVVNVLTRIVYFHLSIPSERKEMSLRLQPRERPLLFIWLPMWPPCLSHSSHSSRFSMRCCLTWAAWWDTQNSAFRQVGFNVIFISLLIYLRSCYNHRIHKLKFLEMSYLASCSNLARAYHVT